MVVPVYAFFILKRKHSVENAGAISAAYGSESAVTFVTSVSYLEAHDIFFSGHMVAVMEAPSIIVGVLLIFPVQQRTGFQTLLSGYPASFSHQWLRHPDFGSLAIGFLASEKQTMGIKPFTTEFKGFLAVFLLDMGTTSGRKLSSFLENGWSPPPFRHHCSFSKRGDSRHDQRTGYH